MSPDNPLEKYAAVLRDVPAIETCLRLLLEAHMFIEADAGLADRFDLSLSELVLGGATPPALHWLVNAGYVRHLGKAGDAPNQTPISERSRFRLSESGVEFARLLAPAAPAPVGGRPHLELPQWDARQRELWFRGQLVKRYKGPAGNQACVLSAFQDRLWIWCIDDPLPRDPNIDAVKRFGNTIQRLNDQRVKLLVFRRNGTGARVSWSPAPLAQAARPSPRL